MINKLVYGILASQADRKTLESFSIALQHSVQHQQGIEISNTHTSSQLKGAVAHARPVPMTDTKSSLGSDEERKGHVSH